MTRQQLLAEAIRISFASLMRYAAGFDDSNHVKQPSNLPNHFAWTLGHLALNLHRIAERVDAKPIPESDFLTADGRGGNRDRFDTESVSLASKPTSDASLYPSHDRCVAIFKNAIDRCAATFAAASDEQLDAMTKFGTMEMPVWHTAIRMVSHNGFHTGQIADLRRALGMKSIFN